MRFWRPPRSFLTPPFLLDWHNASAVFADPVRAHVGLVLLTHQLGYFNILPLYVVLMFAAPLVALTQRLGSWFLLAISFAIYLFVLVFGVNLPTWRLREPGSSIRSHGSSSMCWVSSWLGKTVWELWRGGIASCCGASRSPSSCLAAPRR